MRIVSLYIASSLDGYIARTDGSIDWLAMAHEGTTEDYGYAAYYTTIDTILIGRKTFDQALTFSEYPYPGKQVFIFSRAKAASPAPGAMYLSEDPAAFVSRLKQGPGGKIWLVGGAQINAALFQANLVDEIILTVLPILLGSGIPLFPPLPRPVHLKFVSAKTFPKGLTQFTYQRAPLGQDR